MSEQPYVFDELSVRMAEVGENAGNLDTVLEQLADFQERSLQMKDRILVRFCIRPSSLPRRRA